jgi:hypothetical protein
MNHMRPLTDREKRTVRIAGVGIAIYLALFGAYQVWKLFENTRSEYRQLVVEAQNLRRQVQPYRDKAQVVKKLMESFRVDPAKLKPASVVADASAAIQNQAKTGGIQMGPIRESPAHGSGKGLATVQLEGSGPIPAVLAFLGSLDRIGFPVIVDSVQFAADNSRPGQVKMNLTILILDFEQWKGTEAPHA